MPTALVTGAGIRVGRAIARTLAGAGFDLLLHANRSPLEDLAAELRGLGRKAWVYTADLADPRAVDELAARVRAEHPVLDVLVNNAGVFEAIDFGSIDRERYRRMQAINLEAPFFLAQGLLGSLRAAPAPAIVNITDIAADRPLPRYAHYSVSKAGLVMLTRALAVELAPKIRVNGVAPGTVAFPEDFDEAARAAVLQRIPLGREGSVDDIAGAVLHLVQAPYVTGQVLAVDGGRSALL